MALKAKKRSVFSCRHLRLILLGAGGLGLLITASACTSASSSAKLKPLPVYTTYYPASNYTRPEAIGDAVRISGLNGELATSRAGQALLEKYGQKEAQSVSGTLVSYQHLSALEEAYEAPSEKTTAKMLRSSSGLTERVLITAYSQSGKSYRPDGKSPETGFDAPGFAAWVYRQNGVRVGQATEDMISSGTPVTRNNLRPGDLLIYRDAARPGKHHVGIYSGSGNFIHAPKAGETITESAAFGPQYEHQFVMARRLYNDPQSAPLSRQRKNEITSEAIKTALAQKRFAPSIVKTKVASNTAPKAKKAGGKAVKTRYKTKARR